jgi:hypothetical protein
MAYSITVTVQGALVTAEVQGKAPDGKYLIVGIANPGWEVIDVARNDTEGNEVVVASNISNQEG